MKEIKILANLNDLDRGRGKLEAFFIPHKFESLHRVEQFEELSLLIPTPVRKVEINEIDLDIILNRIRPLSDSGYHIEADLLKEALFNE